MADISKIKLPNNNTYNIKDASAVKGPSSSTADHIATFSDTTGKLIKDSGKTIGTSVPSSAVFTDKYVLQENSTTTNYRSLLMTYSSSSSPSAISGTTNEVYYNNSIYALPSSGSLYANRIYASLHHSRLTWGGSATSGSVNLIDTATLPFLGANRIAFMRAADILVEYSTDAGSTWTTKSLTDAEKASLVTPPLELTINVGNRTANITSDCANYRLRVTLTATSGYTYFLFHNLLLYICTNGATGTKVKVELAHNTSSSTYDFVDLGTWNISGWSGWNSIPFGSFAFGGGDTLTSNYRKLRLTMWGTGVNTSYSSILLLKSIAALGSTCWHSNNNLMKYGTMYSYDAYLNVIFPANVTASSFIKSGGTSSLFLKADGSVDSNSYSTTSHTHTLSLATDSGTNQLTLAHNKKYKLTAGGSTFIFTTPSHSDANVALYLVSTNSYRPLILQATASSSAPPSSTTTTGNSTYFTNNLYANTSTGNLYSSGAMYAVNGFFQTSDITKKNVKGELDLDKAYNLIDKCQTIIYSLKDDKSNKEQIGMIAQEVKEFFPLIVEETDGILSLDYAKLTVVILRVLKDLIDRVKKLEG